MSWLDRRTLLLAPLALTACGFAPVYGTGGPGRALQNQVRVDDPDTRDTYLLTRAIEQQLGRADTPRFALALRVETTEDGLAIDPEGNTRRFNLIGVVDYALRDLGNGQTVASGQVENFTGFSATGTTVATLAAEQDAQKRLMRILADQIVTQLYAAALQ